MHLRRVVPNLKNDESIYVFSRPYYLSFLPWAGLGLAMLIMGIIMALVAYEAFPEIQDTALARNIFIVMTSSFLLLAVPFVTVMFIDYYYDIHVVTDRRLIDIDQHALFVREVNELALEEVQDVTSRHSGVFGNLLDYGSVFIETSSAQQKFEFMNIRYPNQIAGIILDLADQAKMRIERGPGEIVTPRGEIKGVVNDKVINDVKTLEDMGAIVPLKHTEQMGGGIEAGIQNEGADPKHAKSVEVAGLTVSNSVNAKSVHQPMERVEIASIDPTAKERDQSEVVEAKAAATMEPSEPQPAPMQPESAPAPTPQQPDAPKPESSPPPSAGVNDLDIVIDEPDAPRR